MITILNKCLAVALTLALLANGALALSTLDKLEPTIPSEVAKNGLPTLASALQPPKTYSKAIRNDGREPIKPQHNPKPPLVVIKRG